LKRPALIPGADQGRKTLEPIFGQRPSADQQYAPHPEPKTSQSGRNLTLIRADAERLAIAGRVPYAPPLTMRRATISLLAFVALTGCNDHIGDSCGSSIDCSPTGELQCDLSQPGGYCTVFACDADTCPEGACVEWRFIPSRTAETWCMKTCDDDGSCRRSEYSCVFPENITQSGGFSETVLPVEERVARIIDLDLYKAEAKICVALTEDAPASEPEPDAGI